MRFFAQGDVWFQTPLREGSNLFPFEFVLANKSKVMFADEDDFPFGRDGDYFEPISLNAQTTTKRRSADRNSPSRDVIFTPADFPVPVLICSAFSTHVQVLSATIKVNPFHVGNVLLGLEKGLGMGREERTAHFMTNLFNVQQRNLLGWGETILDQVKISSIRNVGISVYATMGTLKSFFGGSRNNLLENKLPMDSITKSFASAKRRLLLLDYGGTTVVDAVRKKGEVLMPTEEMVAVLKGLTRLENTDVYIVSGRTTDEVEQAFAAVGSRLGLVAEHSSFIRHPCSKRSERSWKQILGRENSSWMTIAKNLMELYTLKTYSTYLEEKVSMITWQFREADPDFGNSQAKELQHNLQYVLQAENVIVVKGKGYVEVRPKNCDKGNAAHLLFSKKDYDFVFCAGDDSADEPMFDYFKKLSTSSGGGKEFWTCGVVDLETKAKYQLSNVGEVLSTLESLLISANRLVHSNNIPTLVSEDEHSQSEEPRSECSDHLQTDGSNEDAFEIGGGENNFF